MKPNSYSFANLICWKAGACEKAKLAFNLCPNALRLAFDLAIFSHEPECLVKGTYHLRLCVAQGKL
jgi:hypothetical protein